VNISETTQALALAQAFDNRTVGEVNIRAWHAVLADADAADVMAAIRDHYAEHTDWIMPAHIRTAVRDMVTQREMAARATGWAPGQAGVPKDEAMPEVRGGERLALSDLPAAVAGLVARVRADLPEGSREALMPRRVAWEREHQAFVKMRDATPNPLYKPKVSGSTQEVCRNPRHDHLSGDPILPSCTDPLFTANVLRSGPMYRPDLGPRAGKCDLCGADSGDLAEHVAEYPNGSCA
jgi:hypothetical protein